MTPPSLPVTSPASLRPDGQTVPVHPGQGLFLTLEGGDGAGKTTLIQGLSRHLAGQGHQITVTREPGGTEGAEAVRHLLLTGSGDRWEAMAEVLLLYAARLDHVRRVIVPALGAGHVVICDRFADSTLAYQGYGHGLALDRIRQIHDLTLGGFGPDCTLVLDLDPTTGLARTAGRSGQEHRFERLDVSFHARLRQGFLEIAAGAPQRCTILDASQPAEAVLRAALAALDSRLPRPPTP